MVDARLN